MDSNLEDLTIHLLEKRHRLTKELHLLPYDLVLYLERASVHSDLGYPDLAAGDIYRALLLCDECTDEGFEYHDQAFQCLRDRSADGLPAILRKHGTRQDLQLNGGVEGLSLEGQQDENDDDNDDDDDDDDDDNDEKRILEIAQKASIRCYRVLSISLLLCGCLKSAFEFCSRGLRAAPGDEELLQAKEYIETIARGRLKVDDIDISNLPDEGVVRREVYPWNEYEPNRFSQDTLDFLNAQLAAASPNCEVRVTELPTLLEGSSNMDGYENIPTNKQLGLFANRDIQPGEIVLDEFSLLAANNRLKESLCDACSSELPSLKVDSTVVGCPECDDIMFCDEDCLARAQAAYHPAVCNKDIDTIGKDPDPKEKPFALYMLLLSRALAMAATQEVHPLELKEVKYIWGDFLSSAENAVDLSPNAPPPPVWTLPFSFKYNVSGPLHILEKMDIDIFASLAEYDLWVLNTLYAKFRGTASGRVNPRNGHPEVAAVHPLWCLANHDCDPNVEWEWAAHMKFRCREKRIGGRPGGIKANEEVLSHYCDIDLKVHDRRDWAKGALGGWCMCDRCRREAAEEESQPQTNGFH